MEEPAMNPLLSRTVKDEAVLPNFDTIDPSHIAPAVKRMLEEAGKEFDVLETNAAMMPVQEILEKLVLLDDEFSIQWGALEHLQAVKQRDAVKKELDEVRPLVVQAELKVAQSKPIYKAVKEKQSDIKGKNMERVAEAKIRSCELAGIDLEGDEAAKFLANTERLAKLSVEFSTNCLDSTKAYKKIIEDPAELTGVPKLELESYVAKAKGEGHAEASVEKGPYVLTLDIPSYLPIMQHCDNRKLREEIYKAFITRSSEGPHDNEPIINETLKLRLENAKLLGYKSHAEKQCETKMATVETAQKLMNDVVAKVYPLAVKEHAELAAFAAANGHAENLELWDVHYWAEKMKTKMYSYTEEELKPYFPFNEVLMGLFGLIKRLFSVDIKERDDFNVPKWNEDVRFFEICDTEGETVAYFYIDCYVRPEEKRGGAWMNQVVQASDLHKTATGKHRVPIAHIVCNNPRPVGDRPSLMSWRDVETLFHEMGHGLQHMLTKEYFSSCSGINNIEWDAVEIPSQFMENWVYDYPTVSRFAKHYETGEVFPRSLFDKVETAKNFRSASFLIRQLKFGLVDFYLHLNYDPTTDKRSVFEVERETLKPYCILPPYEKDRFLCQFQHIFAGGYSAGYYSYLWAEVLSADCFEAFNEVGLENDKEIVELGMKFRNTILAKGGGLHPSDVFHLFRGREPSIDALLKHRGL